MVNRQLPTWALSAALVVGFMGQSWATEGNIKPSKVRLGPVYAIAEPDMLDEIAAKLSAMQKDGSLKRLQDEATAKGLASAKRPQGLGLPRALVSRQWVHDPTYIVPQDIADHQGRVFARAGDTINPLEKGVGLRQPLLFVDMDDEVQVQAMPALLKHAPNAKVILVNGDWTQATERLGQAVFFDQRGTLVKRFGITAVPAVVQQSGKVLQVTEFALATRQATTNRTNQAGERP